MRFRTVTPISLTAAICVAFLLTLSSLDRIGRQSRVEGPAAALGRIPPRVRLAKNSADVYSIWVDSGLRGRKLVSLSRFLHFVPIPATDAAEGLDRFPISTFDLLPFYKERLDATNLLWVTLQAGTVRSVYHVLPAEDLSRRLAQLGPETAGVRVRGRQIHTHETGSPRWVLDELPALDETVLLSVDASYLEAMTTAQLFESLQRQELITDLVILNRAEDNPEVSLESRRRLDELARILGLEP